MAEFDEKLNSLLSNPDAMSQIMQLAQSLGGGSQPPPPSQPEPAWNPTPPSGTGWNPQAQSGPGWNPQGQSGNGWNPQAQSGPPPAGDFLSSLTGGLDPKLISRLLPLIQELGGQRDSNARNLLYALRPYLKAERQDKIERALQLARLFHLGRKFLSGWGGSGDV